MVTAIASTPKQRSFQNSKRQPLLPSDTDNGQPRRPKAREVTSRYLSLSASSSSSSNSSSSTNTTLSSVTSGSSISSRRSQSPMPSSRAAISTPKSQQRARSAERRLPAAKTPSSSERMLMTSTRSSSVSFQGEPYSLPVSKVKPPPGGLRKSTPERRKAGVILVRDRRERDGESSKPSEQQQRRWPGRLRAENSSILSRSLDYGAERVQSSGSSSALKEFRKSMVDENTRNNIGAELKLGNNDIVGVRGISELDSPSRLGDSPNLDTERVSPESTASGNATLLRGAPRRVVVPARFLPDGSNRALKVLDPDSPLSSGASNKGIGPPKLIGAKKFPNNSPTSSPREGFGSRGLSPLRGGVRAASPSKASTSSTVALFRGLASPSRARSGEGISMNENNTYSTPSMYSFAVNMKRGKLGENRIADAHDLRLLYNRMLQWRLANAKVENSLFVREQRAERTLYNAWMAISKLRLSVGSKRIELQSLRHNLKLYSILKEQEPHLECWGMFDRDHCNSVSGAIEALEASTIRLPIVSGAKADVREVQEAISLAVDMMQSMSSSLCSSLAKVEQMNLLVSELSNIRAREHRLLNECKDFLSTDIIPSQVMHCSLRIHVMQAQQEPTSLAKKI